MSKPTRKCAVEGCENTSATRGWCPMHYARVKRHGNPGGPEKQHAVSWAGITCSVDSCDSPARARGFCMKHYKRWYKTGSTEKRQPQPLNEYMAERTVVGDVPEGRPGLGPCHLWTVRVNAAGYGLIGLRGEHHNDFAHRVAYQQTHGAIPDGLVIDHLCRVRNCVNPDHLEAVTNEENLRRGYGYRLQNGMDSSCINGHPYTEKNTYTDSRGRISCRECSRIRDRKRSPRVRRQK